MTQEEKKLFISALCGYLPYGIVAEENCCCNDEWLSKYPPDKELQTIISIDLEEERVVTNGRSTYDIEEFKIFLRPLSSMTDKEADEWADDFLEPLEELEKLPENEIEEKANYSVSQQFIIGLNWLFKRRLDAYGLIEKGLALEAPKNMYIDGEV